MDELKDELACVSREKRVLQVAAYMWERHAPHCTGLCVTPTPVAVDIGGTFVLDCCAFFLAYQHFTLLRGTEAMLRDRIKHAA